MIDLQILAKSGVARRTLAAAAKFSARGRDNAVGLTWIPVRGQSI